MNNIGQFTVGQTPQPQDFTSLNDPSIQAVLSQFGITSDTMTDAISQLNSLAAPPGTSPKKPIPSLANAPVLEGQNPQASTQIPNNKKPPTYAQNFAKSFNANLGTVATAKNLSPQEMKNLQFLMNNPGANLDDAAQQKKLQGVINQVLGDVQSDLTSKNLAFDKDPQTGQIIPPSSMRSVYQNQMAASYNSNFNAELNKLQLSPEDAAKVTYAHYNPGTELPPNLQQALQKAQGAAIQDMRNAGLVVPNGFTPPTNAAAFNGEITAQFSQSVEDAINNLGQQKGMTNAQIQSSIFLFNNPGAGVGNKALVSQALGQVMGQLGPKFGLPPGFTPPPNTAGHNAVLNGDFSMTFQNIIGTLPLTSEQLAKVRAGIGDPATMDANIKPIVDTAWTESIALIQHKNGLPVTWSPSISLTDAGKLEPAKNLIAQTQEMAAGINMQLTNLPPGVQKDSFINIMMLVGQVLNELKAITSKSQTIDSQLGLQTSKAQTASQLDKIKKQQETQAKLNEMEKKLGMTQSGGLAGMIIACAAIAAIGVIFCCIPFLEGFGAALIACAAVLLAFTIAGSIVNADPNANPATKTALMVCNIVVEVIAAIIMTIATFGAGSGAAGAMLGGESAEAGVEAATAALEAETQVVSASLEAGTEAASAAAESAAEGVSEGTNVVKESLFQGMKQSIQQFRQSIKEAWDGASVATQRAKQITQVASHLNDAASAGMRVQQSLVRRDLALKKGELDKYMTEMDALIKVLTKFINLMLGGLPELGDWMKDINQQQSSMIAGASKSLGGLMRS